MPPLTRRGFLQLAGLTLGAAAYVPPPEELTAPETRLARVAARTVPVRARPEPEAPQLATLVRDTIVSIKEETWSAKGPQGNPYWYRLDQGFAHSGDLQPVRFEPGQVVNAISPEGMLVEVALPYTQARQEPSAQAVPLYRLYYGATFWAVDIARDADGGAWYALLDDRLYTRYYARAEHLRPVAAEDLSPIAPEVPPEDKRIEVDLARQRLTAYEDEQAVFTTHIRRLPAQRPEPGSPASRPSASSA
jgi:hypothetical protein